MKTLRFALVLILPVFFLAETEAQTKAPQPVKNHPAKITITPPVGKQIATLLPPPEENPARVFYVEKKPDVPVAQISGTVYDATDRSPLVGVSVRVKGTSKGTVTNEKGQYAIGLPNENAVLVFNFIGFVSKEILPGKKVKLDVLLQPRGDNLSEVVVTGYGLQGKLAGVSVAPDRKMRFLASAPAYDRKRFNTESYSAISENEFRAVRSEPLSTFAADVDAASYSNIRRYINQGSLPPKDAVRVEEMINYFPYDLPEPKGADPVSVSTELATAPWNVQHKLLRIGIKAKNLTSDKMPASNLVFLIDVSGSMEAPNKLELVKSSMKLLADQIRPKDRVSIVVYAGAAGIVLEPTSEKPAIKEALENLRAGGSTAGGAGIKLAYATARKNYIKNGNNRVVLATDGDFNIGASSDAEMQRLIEQERESGIFLSVLGYGMGNYKDSKMETLADKGNGNYAYIDDLDEARKVLVHEFGSTLYTVAKDVKLQIEFNPKYVQAYRLVGYENRLLNKEDFNDDKKDAGEVGSGHTVTALYELIPAGAKDQFSGTVDPLKYQSEKTPVKTASGEWATVKVRYKNPNASKSMLLQKAVAGDNRSFSSAGNDFRFAAAVAEWGMLLRDSKFKQKADVKQVISLAKGALGNDESNYRRDFIRLVEKAGRLKRNEEVANAFE